MCIKFKSEGISKTGDDCSRVIRERKRCGRLRCLQTKRQIFDMKGKQNVGCVPFGESKNGFSIPDLPDFEVEKKKREIRNQICNIDTFRKRDCVICMTASQEMTCFLLFDKLCDYTVQNFFCRQFEQLIAAMEHTV